MKLATAKETFERAEQAGLKLAIKGRLAALLILGILFVASRGAERAPDFILGISGFAILGIIHYRIIGSSWDNFLIKYVFVTIDIALLSIAVAIIPPIPEPPLPQIYMFKFGIFFYYFIILGVAAFSLSPGLVIWTGVAGSVGWLAAFMHVYNQIENPLTWGDIQSNSTTDEFIAIFNHPDFTASGSRVQEAIIFMVVAMLIAIVMHRARKTVRKQLEAERENQAISQLFGRFVPSSIVDTMIRNKGTLSPTERVATILFCDLEGFTKMTEAKGPKEIVETLNSFFDEASKIIGENNGVVTQFQGDGILATFNTPVDDPHHAKNAFNTAIELVDLVENNSFGGENLKLRVGISTGPIVAGSIGGGGRQSYTVYGEPVNLASRLENLNKDYGTSILFSQSTRNLLEDVDLDHIGDVLIRGLNEPTNVYSCRDLRRIEVLSSSH